MEKLLFLLFYLSLFPLLLCAIRAGFRPAPEPLAGKNQHDEERAGERKVDIRAADWVIRELLPHVRVRFHDLRHTFASL
jgi:integrase